MKKAKNVPGVRGKENIMKYLGRFWSLNQIISFQVVKVKIEYQISKKN